MFSLVKFLFKKFEKSIKFFNQLFEQPSELKGSMTY